MRDASARSIERRGGVGCDEALKVSSVTSKAMRVAAKANEPQLRPIRWRRGVLGHRGYVSSPEGPENAKRAGVTLREQRDERPS